MIGCLLSIGFGGVITAEDFISEEPEHALPEIKAPSETSFEEIIFSETGTPEIQPDDTASKKDIEDYERILAFQREVIPVLDETFHDIFPTVVDIEGDIKAETFDSNLLDEMTDFYFDNSNSNDLKVVFVVAKEDQPEMKTLRAELENKLGDKVIFKKAKKSLKEFQQMQEQVAEYIDETYDGRFAVTYNIETQALDVEIASTDSNSQSLIPKPSLNNTEIAALNEMIGSEFINIILTDELPEESIARNYPFSNLGGGQEIRLYRSATPEGLCTSGYVAYKDNQAFLVTAGHCLRYAAANQSTYSVREGNSADGFKTLGYEHWSGYNATSRYDFGLIRLTNSNLQVTSRLYTDANGGGINGQLKPYLPIGSSGIKVGLAINKSGNKTGITGATITSTGTTVDYGAGFTVAVIRSELRSGYGELIDGKYTAVAGSGDSGGTVYRASDYALVGVQSGISTGYTDQSGAQYGTVMYVSPAWYANSLLGSTFYQYTRTYDTPVSQMQGL